MKYQELDSIAFNLEISKESSDVFFEKRTKCKEKMDFILNSKKIKDILEKDFYYVIFEEAKKANLAYFEKTKEELLNSLITVWKFTILSTAIQKFITEDSFVCEEEILKIITENLLLAVMVTFRYKVLGDIKSVKEESETEEGLPIFTEKLN